MHVRYHILSGVTKYAHSLDTDFARIAKTYPHALDEDPMPDFYLTQKSYGEAGPLADARIYGDNDPELRRELDEGLLQLEAMKRIGGQISRIHTITERARRAKGLG